MTIDQLILEHMKLVRVIARKRKHTLPATVSVEDLYSAGLLGLVQAAPKWDPGKGTAFKTYASFRIHGAITDHLREMDWMNRSERKESPKRRVISFETMSGDDVKWEDMLEERDATKTEKALLAGVPEWYLRGLNSQERTLIVLYYQNRMTMREVAAILGISEAMVCMIHRRVLDILRERIELEEKGASA